MSCNIGRAKLGAAVLLVCAIGLSGCGSKHSAASVPNHATTTTTSGVTADNSAIEDGYRQFQADYEAVGATMNLDDPRLSAHATGAELTQVRMSLVALKNEGDVLRGTVTVHPTVTSVDGDSAVLSDCSIDAGYYLNPSTGKTSNTAATNNLNTVTMQRVDGVWKVASLKGVGTGCTPDAN